MAHTRWRTVLCAVCAGLHGRGWSRLSHTRMVYAQLCILFVWCIYVDCVFVSVQQQQYVFKNTFTIQLPTYTSLIPESPRWLLATGRVEQAVKVLNSAARINRAKIPAHVDFYAVADAIKEVNVRILL